MLIQTSCAQAKSCDLDLHNDGFGAPQGPHARTHDGHNTMGGHDLSEVEITPKQMPLRQQYQ